MKRMLLAFLELLATAPSVMGQAKDFQNKTVKVIVSYTAGSGSDTSARFFGEKLAVMLGQPFVVENKPGASGVLSVMAVKAAPADGYTILLVGTSRLAVDPFTIKDLSYDPTKDLKPHACDIAVTFQSAPRLTSDCACCSIAKSNIISLHKGA